MSRRKDNEPSTSSEHTSKKIKREKEDYVDIPSYVQAADIKEEIEEKYLTEELFIKEEIEPEVAGPSTSHATIATQTEYPDDVDDINERKANEAVEKLMASLQPKEKAIRGPTVNATDAHVFQFHITLLRGSGAPKIWRRFKVPANYTFRQFHIAIQKVMGWKSVQYDYHLHAFRVLNARTCHIDEILMSDELRLYPRAKDENVVKIRDYFTIKNQKGRYEYDFGCCWQHEFIFESCLMPAKGETYPKCLGGAKACPPEDGCVQSDEEYDSDEFDPEACF